MANNDKSQSNVSQTGDKSLVFVSSTQQEPPSHSHEIAEQKSKKWRDLGLEDRAMVLLTLGILVIGGVTARILRNQFNEMSNQTEILAAQFESDAVSGSLSAIQIQKQLFFTQQQAKAAQNQAAIAQSIFRSSERPWVGPIKRAVFITNDSHRLQSAIWMLQNGGRTAALHLTVHLDFFVGPPLNLATESNYPRNPSCNAPPKAMTGGLLVLPNVNTTDLPVDVTPDIQKSMDDVYNGKVGLFAVGCLFYTDMSLKNWYRTDITEVFVPNTRTSPPTIFPFHYGNDAK